MLFFFKKLNVFFLKKEEDIERNIQYNIIKYRKSKMESNNCPVCFEIIDETKNVCSTPCGHKFCFNCMVKCLKNNSTCPCCRQVIDEDAHNQRDEVLSIEFSDSDNDEDVDEDDDDDSSGMSDFIEDDEEYEEDGCTIETIERGLKEKNVSYLELISLLVNRYPKNTTKSMIKKIEKKMFDIISELDEENSMEKKEFALMHNEDKNVGVESS